MTENDATLPCSLSAVDTQLTSLIVVDTQIPIEFVGIPQTPTAFDGSNKLPCSLSAGEMGEEYWTVEHAEWYHETFEDLK